MDKKNKPEEFGKNLWNSLLKKMMHVKNIDEFKKTTMEAAKVAAANTLVQMGIMAYQHGDFSLSQENWNRALSIYQEVNAKKEQAVCLDYLGLAFKQLGQIEKAIEYGEKALGIEREIGDQELEAATLGNVGSSYRVKGDLQKALQYRERSLEIFRTLKDKHGEMIELLGTAAILSDLGNLDRALERHRQALEICREIGAYKDETAILDNINKLQQMINRPSPTKLSVTEDKATKLLKLVQEDIMNGNYSAALPKCEEALKIYLQNNNDIGCANTLNVVAGIYNEMGEWSKAIDAIDEAIKLFRKLGITQISGLISNKLLIFRNRGIKGQNMEALQETLDLCLEIGDKKNAVDTLMLIVDACRQSKDFSSALDYQREALTIYREIGDKFGEAVSLDNLGAIHREIGKLSDALSYSKNALEIFKEIGAEKDAAIAMANIGQILFSMGSSVEALEYLVESAEICRKNGDWRSEVACLDTIGLICEKERRFEDALDCYQRALTILQGKGDRDLENHIRIKISSLYSRSGIIPFGDMKLIIKSAQETKNIHQEAQGLEGLAGSSFVMGKYSEALDYLSQAIKLLGDRLGPDHKIFLLVWRARIYRKLDRLKDALQDYFEAIKLVESLRGGISEIQYKQSYFGEGKPMELYKETIDTLLHQEEKDLKKVFELIERVKGRTLIEQLGENIQFVPFGKQMMDDPERVRILSRLVWQNRSFQEAKRKLKSASSSEDREQAMNQLSLASKEMESVLDEVEPIAPQYVALRRGESTSFKEIKQLLDFSEKVQDTGRRTILVEYYCTDEYVLILAVRPDWSEPKSVKIPIRKDNLRTFVSEYFSKQNGQMNISPIFQRLLTANQDKWQSFLSPLVEPILDWAESKDNIYLIPHDVLHYVPLHSVKVKNKYLIEHNPVAYLPNASSLKYCKIGQLSKDQYRALVMGDSQHPFYPLPYAREEARQIGHLLGSPVYLGTKASKQRLFSHLKKYQGKVGIIHLACHGAFDPTHPLKSGIELSDGRLTAEDIFGLELSANLVVLSACESGVNKLMPGDELFGLTRALMYAGVPSIIVSLWEVNDISTEILMIKFYEGLKKGLSKVVALQQAQVSMMNLSKKELNQYLIRRGRINMRELEQSYVNIEDFLSRHAWDDIPNASRFIDSEYPYRHFTFWAPFVLVGNWR